MISSRLRSETLGAFGVLILCCIAGVACDLKDDTSESTSLIAVGQEGESGRSVQTYYGEMWFRTWQAPLMAVLAGTSVLTMFMFSLGITGIQGAAEYHKVSEQKEQQQKPVVVDGYIESYGDPPRHSLWG